MKPGPADLWLWEAKQARDVPAWVRALDEKCTAKMLGQNRREKLTVLVHQAINARAGVALGPLSLRNTISLLQMVRRHQIFSRERGYRLRELDGSESPRTLYDYMRRTRDDVRGRHFRRFLRRMAK